MSYRTRGVAGDARIQKRDDEFYATNDTTPPASLIFVLEMWSEFRMDYRDKNTYSALAET